MANRKPTYQDLENQVAELSEENDLLSSRLDLVTSAASGDLDDIDEESDDESEEE